MNQASGVFNPLGDDDGNHAKPQDSAKPATVKRPLLEFAGVDYFLNYVEPPGFLLGGDRHFSRGSVSVLAGMPSIGKTGLMLRLAVMLATGRGTWCGIEIKARVRVVIFQSENDDERFSKEFQRMRDEGLLTEDINEWLRISKIPLCGLDLERAEFRAIALAEMTAFQPGFVMLDPWNSAAKKDMIDDYQRAFEALLSLAEVLDEPPGWLIVHHLKKLKVDDFKLRGRSLMALLAGSYLINSRPRSVFVAMEESPFVHEPMVIVTCAKNNNGKDGQRAAMRRDGSTLLDISESYDWTAYDSGELLGGRPGGSNAKVEFHHLEEIFDHGKRWLHKNDATKKLMEVASCGHSTAYDTLSKVKSRFADKLRVRDGGEMTIESPWPDEDDE